MALTRAQAGWLVTAAAAGDSRAWNALVDAYEGAVWATVRRHRLSESDARDAYQTVWLRLIENIDRLRYPARVGGWLLTTARRECFRIAAQSHATASLEDSDAYWPMQPDEAEIDADLLRQETVDEIRAAVAQLPEHWQALLHQLMADPPKQYQQIADELDIPVGSIGPTRGRCLRRLREILEASHVGFKDWAV